MNPVLSMCKQTASGIDYSSVIEILKASSRLRPFINTPSKRPPRKSTISPIMYSFSCVNLAQKYYLAFRVKWLGEQESIYRLCEVVREDIEKLAKDDHWQVKPDHLTKLIHLSVIELYSPGLKIPYKDKLEYLGITKDTYYRRYKHYLNQIYADLDDYTNVAYSHIKKHLRG